MVLSVWIIIKEICESIKIYMVIMVIVSTGAIFFCSSSTDAITILRSGSASGFWTGARLWLAILFRINYFNRSKIILTSVK